MQTTTHQDNPFGYTLGGITVKGTSEDCYSLKKCALTEGTDFFSSAPGKEYVLSDEVIRVHCALLRQGDSHLKKEKKSFHPCLNLFATPDGYLQQFYLAEDENNLVWNVAIDPDFSRFDYYIHQDKTQNVSPLSLAANMFLLQHSFINCQGLIIHSAGGSIQGRGIVFAATSGTGKSTLSKLLLPSQQNRLFSEERLIVRSIDDSWNVWGTPWGGENNIARNETAPLSALIFLSQSTETKVNRLTPAECLHRLLQVASIPWYSEEWVNKGLAICESLIQDVPMFELAFRPDQSAVQAVEELASGL